MIPKQLQVDGFGFVKLPAKSKRPVEAGWQNKPHPLAEALEWLSDGKNYGVLGGQNGLIIIDADKKIISDLVRDGLPDTFTVKTPRMGEHFYYICPEIKSKIILRQGSKGEEAHFGEIISGGGQVVGPGSIHPDTGTPYIVVNDVPIETVTMEQILSILHDYIPSSVAERDPAVEVGGLQILEVIDKKHIVLNKIGGQLAGAHPIHGATNGNNFNVNTEKNVWCCYRHNTGGGALSLIAVLEGVIDCSEAVKGSLSGDKFKAALKAARKAGFNVDDYVSTPTGAYTDLWAARLFRERYGADLRWCSALGGWLIWDGTRWLLDDVLKVEQMAESIIQEMHDQAATTNDKKLKSFATKRENDSQFRTMISRLRALDGVPTKSSSFDMDTYLLNCLNGTLDLRTMDLRPHSREHNITRRIEVKYTPDSLCHRWDSFLLEIFEGNKDLIEYVQRAVGYSLSGDIREHCLFVLYGTGRNGKSTLLKHIRSIIGDYGATANSALLIEKKMDGGIPNDVARLRGVRMVTVQESKRNGAFDESQVKALTGGDGITARFLNKEFFEFSPTHKIFLATNHKPEVSGTDAGIWSKIKPIPFNKSFLGDEADKDLDAKLRAEYEGILNWMVEGYRKWQLCGLGENKDVSMAAQEYQDESDVMKLFIDEACELGPGLSVAVKDLREAIAMWTKTSRIRSIRLGEITDYLEKKVGLKKERPDHHGGGWFWTGISLIERFTSLAPDFGPESLVDRNVGNERPY